MSVLALTFGMQTASAQPQGGPGGPGADRGNREQMRAQWEQRMNDRLKEALKVNDEEWSVLQPRIKAVSDLQRQNRAGSMRGWGRPQRGGDNNNTATAQPERELSPIQKASKELQETLDKEGATAEAIKAKLDAYRAAKTAAEAELTKAQAQLRELLTVNQEAQLVLMGILD
jgi:chromosome segregation ATPase